MQQAGCVPCFLEAKLQGREYVPEPPDIHHVDQDNPDATYANCPWHHRGIRKNELDYLEMQRHFGPSMARNPARYRERYGSEDELLACQTVMIEEWCKKWGIEW